MAEAKEVKAPEIEDVELTHQLMQIASSSANDRTLSAIHNAAYVQLGSINAALQEQVDKQNEAAAKKLAAEEAKAAEDAKQAQRKAEDEEAAAAKKAAADEAKANKTHA
jgi:topoisomerase IA-like protein